MNTVTSVVGLCLAGDNTLALDDFSAACGANSDFVRLLVEEGLLQPTANEPAWRFGGEELARVRRIRRLQRDFEANLQSVAVMLDLIEEAERLRARLHSAGFSAR
jgi:chaperone modulatory protein CbpM